jgi:hypothetical protein
VFWVMSYALFMSRPAVWLVLDNPFACFPTCVNSLAASAGSCARHHFCDTIRLRMGRTKETGQAIATIALICQELVLATKYRVARNFRTMPGS